MPAPTSLSDLKAAQRSLLLKPLDAAVFLAPWPTPAPASFTDGNANLQPLPSDYKPVGLIDKKTGIAFARGITAAPIEAYGELQPVRNDITSDITTIEFQPQQTSLTTLQLTTGAALQQLSAAAGSGEVFFPQPTSEQITYYSAIIIGKDGNDAAPVYVFKVLPKVAVSKYGGEQWTPTEVLSQKLTLVAFKDDAAGYAVAHGFGGAGWQKLLAASGIKYTISSIKVVPQTLSIVRGNSSAPLVVNDQYGGTITAPVIFNSSATSVATVAANGVVTGVAAGSATITASFTPAGSSTALTATCAVTVS
ncbi:phage tail tube protein [Nocardia pseudobrasiliensis]|uniref:Ig-like protein group 2 n=1 Tax=Nocardia pseudobrasiliensis TaxID=45979 RepID=A0A370HXM3_9NOCA|nr:Ig-like domain-containing protein [Nocardia pseudobrasiliensis]RDI63219.1 Ig-like protein group 2 [Nocardia pseudobrasiliensis]